MFTKQLIIVVGPFGEVGHLKARLGVKGYTQIYGLVYGDTFSPIAKITTIQLFLFINLTLKCLSS